MNNSLSISLEKRCSCGRYITLGEVKAGIGTFGYVCPDCLHRRYSKPLTSEEYYNQISRVLKSNNSS